MIQSKEDYLYALANQIRNSSSPHSKKDLIHEIDMHITEMLFDLKEFDGLDEATAMEKVVDRLGTPEQVAKEFLEETDVTPTKMQWMFISINLLFFIGGIALTVTYNLLPVTIIDELWLGLTSITTLIIILYMFFWVLLGYEIGKEFGLGGKALLFKTFYIALLPNLILMSLVVFQIMPSSWFDPLLTPSFIAVCILCTAFLYPISYAGFRWGTIRSV
ncbi:HAAS signaling domain-containing protein [Evansella tamaricis]|uniref:Uncharacterized protein n=1 Tax=Evansella tamaricis TaxID=2069301 RepID=A0ABS6JCY5_9BACI|nr:permease prefix domain 1-containing protein [Evansella tamaricis]MBU9711526.1 hypothetical protein [Evansella tamaricis]